MIGAQQPRAMPVRWSIVFAAVVLVAGLAIGLIVGYMRATDHARPVRLFLEAVEIPGERQQYQVRWIEDGLPRFVVVEGLDTRDRLIAWLSRW